MHDPLGDEMKALERASAPEAFPRDLPIYARIDGRGFSRFTRGMKRPFDERMTNAMLRTAVALFKDTGAKAAYVQSDEISLVWEPTPEVGEHFFGGKPFKMCSVLAGLATAHFTKAILHSEIGLADFADRLPHFDARVVGMPDRRAAAQMVAWRAQDARRNAVTMIAQSRYSHKSLQGVSSTEMRKRLTKDGVTMRSFPEISLNGAFIYSTREMRPLEEKIRMKIPEHKRPAPDHLFERKTPMILTYMHPGQIGNLEAVIFEEAEPVRHLETKTEAQETA